MRASQDKPPVVILLPTYNDWQALELLLQRLDAVMDAARIPARVLVIDDGSTEPAPESLSHLRTAALHTVELLRLRRNLGHQRAIAVGLTHIHAHFADHRVVVMDADGEDRPEDVPLLLDQQLRNPSRILFAARTRRMEGFAFRFSYQSYRIFHRVLTGVPVRVGNFSVVPPQALPRLVVLSELWNHYAAAVIRARVGHLTMPIARGMRLAGRTKMNFVALLVHGLGAISVYSEMVGARLFIGTVGLMVMAALAAAAVLAVRTLSGATLPPWTVYALGVMLLVLMQCVVFSLFLVFALIGNRMSAGFMPVRDCGYFVESVIPLVGSDSNS